MDIWIDIHKYTHASCEIHFSRRIWELCVCVCVCMYVCMYICMYVYMYICIHTHISSENWHLRTLIYSCMCLGIYMYGGIYIYMYVSICMYLGIYMYGGARICGWLCISIMCTCSLLAWKEFHQWTNTYRDRQTYMYTQE